MCSSEITGHASGHCNIRTGICICLASANHYVLWGEPELWWKM